MGAWGAFFDAATAGYVWPRRCPDQAESSRGKGAEGMMDEFDLQLFSDAGEEAGATGEDSGAGGPVEKVALDENGEVRVFREEPAAKGEDEGIRGDDGEQACYSPEEVRATDFDKLDPGRILRELLPWYKSMQAGFTRKTQELAAEKRAVREVLEQARGGTQPAAAEAAHKAYVRQVAEAARGQVERYFNEGYDAFNPAHQTAMSLAVQQIYADVARAAGQQEALLGLEAELKGQETNYEAIYEYAKAKVAELQHADYARLQEAFASGDVRTLRTYFEAARRGFYAERQGVRRGERSSSAAPRLEGAGGGAAGGKEPPNFAELGRLKNFDDKLAWLRRHNIKP